MPLLLFFLLIVILFPALLIPVGSLIMLLILFIPFKFTLDSLITLITAPEQIIKIAVNPKLRRNHALEHATINVLEESYGHQHLSGLAKENGFLIQGAINPIVLQQAAEEGLHRLKAGETDLVIHDRCGTSLMMGNLISALIFFGLLLSTGNFTIIYVLIAVIFSRLLGPTIGKYAQKLLTTSPDVEGMVIDGIRSETNFNNFFGINIRNQPQKLFVKTERLEVY
ncbi:DUF6391 domain-containing protein [Sporohalobacter salinus]|uniref:DUF6391 domain-containing protein n=1 Tax=Sporohalobacter salinus TaxID=1494606 RepID=UPI001960991C|nr:DUF6391 domain-containing protein [Sporohalobacter salinus]MBM7623309.1 hypothetical protein [Sporohalobacter salinus]